MLVACHSNSPEARDLRPTDGLPVAGSGLPDAKVASLQSGIPDLEPPLPVLTEPHFSAFDLLANRPFAHRLEDVHSGPTLAVDALSKDFLRYIHGNHGGDWLLSARAGDARGAGIKGRTTRMWLPAFGDLEQSFEVRVRLFNPARGHNELTIAINNFKLPGVRLDEGWQEIRVPVEHGSALRPENRVDLTFSNLGRIEGQLAGGALAWVRLGPVTSDEDAVEPESMASTPMEQGPLMLDAGEGASWHVWIPEDAKLTVDMEAMEGCGVSLNLLTESEEGTIVSRMSEKRNLVDGRGEQQQSFFDLSAFAGQVARLNLMTTSTCESAVHLRGAEIVVPGERPAIPAGVEPPKYVIFWVIDTLRADHLPIHFETDVQAPNLKRLAEGGASFKVAYVQGTESRVSHASLFTGLYPNRHRVLARGRVQPGVHVIQEMMQQAGYKTGAFASNGYVSHLLGLNRGWDFFINNIHAETSLDGMSMARDGVRWAMENQDDPFFLYLGTIDPHVTYRRHDDIIGIYDKEPYGGRFQRFVSGDDLGLIKARRLDVNERDKRRIHNMYKNEITFNDRAFGYLREELEQAGIWEQTMVVVTSDHGEEFWEHGNVGHGQNIHQEMVHVPFVVYYPPLIPAGTVVEAGVDIIDVFPTVAHAIGQKRPEGQQGKSVLPLIHGLHGGYPEPAIATQYLRHYAMQMQHWKLYLRRGEFQIYDRRTDPLEQKNVSSNHPLASRWMLDTMSWFRPYRAEWDKEEWGPASNLNMGFFDRLEKK